MTIHHLSTSMNLPWKCSDLRIQIYCKKTKRTGDYFSSARLKSEQSPPPNPGQGIQVSCKIILGFHCLTGLLTELTAKPGVIRQPS